MASAASLPLVDSLIETLMAATSETEAKTEDIPAKSESESREKKPRVVFVLGGPGAGKGTQCAKLVDEFGFVHLSAGDLLRRERDSGSEKAELIKSYIKEGQIVPVAITVGLIKSEMQTQMKDGKFVFVIDGFPRNYDNLTGWQEVCHTFRSQMNSNI